MTWARLDDGFWRNPKITALTDRQFRLYVNAIAYVAEHLTDGLLDDFALRSVAAASGINRPRTIAAALVQQGLFVELPGGYTIHDYLEYNPTRAEVEQTRRKAAQRTARHRARHYGQKADDPVDYEAILERDGLRCHICQKPVSPSVITFDHVVPLAHGGKHHPDNIRVAHARCNAGKRDDVTPLQNALPNAFQDGVPRTPPTDLYKEEVTKPGNTVTANQVRVWWSNVGVHIPDNARAEYLARDLDVDPELADRLLNEVRPTTDL